MPARARPGHVSCSRVPLNLLHFELYRHLYTSNPTVSKAKTDELVNTLYPKFTETPTYVNPKNPKNVHLNPCLEPLFGGVGVRASMVSFGIKPCLFFRYLGLGGLGFRGLGLKDLRFRVWCTARGWGWGTRDEGVTHFLEMPQTV